MSFDEAYRLKVAKQFSREVKALEIVHKRLKPYGFMCSFTDECCNEEYFSCNCIIKGDLQGKKVWELSAEASVDVLRSGHFKAIEKIKIYHYPDPQHPPAGWKPYRKCCKNCGANLLSRYPGSWCGPLWCWDCETYYASHDDGDPLKSEYHDQWGPMDVRAAAIYFDARSREEDKQRGRLAEDMGVLLDD